MSEQNDSASLSKAVYVEVEFNPKKNYWFSVGELAERWLRRDCSRAGIPKGRYMDTYDETDPEYPPVKVYLPNELGVRISEVEVPLVRGFRCTYWGRLEAGLPTGYGELRIEPPSGSYEKTYRGTWKDGRFHGKGTICSMLSSHSVDYYGLFKNGLRDGLSKWTSISGTYFELWEDGVLKLRCSMPHQLRKKYHRNGKDNIY